MHCLFCAGAACTRYGSTKFDQLFIYSMVPIMANLEHISEPQVPQCSKEIYKFFVSHIYYSVQVKSELIDSLWLKYQPNFPHCTIDNLRSVRRVINATVLHCYSTTIKSKCFHGVFKGFTLTLEISTTKLLQ